MAKLVSKTYGDAFFQVAVEAGKIDVFYDEVKAIQNLLRENEDMQKLMSHPKIVKEEKINVLEKSFKGNISDELLGLMRMLVEKDHFAEIDAVLQYIIDAVKEYKNIGTAYVKSAMELTETQKKQVEQKLLETTGYVEFEMHYAVDAALIGGMVIRIKDHVVDSSIRTKLYKLTQDLTKIQLKAGEVTP